MEDVLRDLEELPEDRQQLILKTIPTVWPVSHSLCFSVMKTAANNPSHISTSNLEEWLRRILYYYEKGGLVRARAYMAASIRHIDLELRDNSQSVPLDSHLNRLACFARGLSPRDLTLQPAGRIYTDTDTIFLPARIKALNSQEENILLYKLLIALQCGFIEGGTFSRQVESLENAGPPPASPSAVSRTADLEKYFAGFSAPKLLRDLFQLIETARVMDSIRQHLPGLVAETAHIRQSLFSGRTLSGEGLDQTLNDLYRKILLPEADAAPVPAPFDLVPSEGPLQSWRLAEEFYRTLLYQGEEDSKFSFLPFMDSFDLNEALLKREARIEKVDATLVAALADFITQKVEVSRSATENEADRATVDDVRVMLKESGDEKDSRRIEASLTIDNNSFEFPDDLLQLIRQIKNDTGSLPQGSVSAACGIAGQGRPPSQGLCLDQEPGDGDFIHYDEWDFRRQGYRKNWCSLRERPLVGVKSDFVERTRVKYSGALRRISRQFELLRTQERFARRQRHGDDIDLDALVDSLGDQRAGLPPSENLFVRLLRSQRNIATVFLVDMSNSTEGWVGKTIKEALVLLAEALEIVGDRYAIFGFSGMRRMRSEVYRIKALEEPYGAEVKARLAAVSPKEYTRMGPPLRHMIQYFRGVDSKTRLLIILSDGKPEDYDDYKGRYALEDTRKALAEAKGNSIHPYCITIDRQAQSYLDYLFGAGYYTFVKNIETLPSRLSEIYRLLTR